MARPCRWLRHPGEGRSPRGTHRGGLLERRRAARSGAPEAGPRPPRVAGISGHNAGQTVRYTLARGPVTPEGTHAPPIGPRKGPPRGGLISLRNGTFLVRHRLRGPRHGG